LIASGHFDAGDIPDLSGSTMMVTGATSGLGFQAALELARHGAHVVMACRDPSRGDAAARRIEAACRGAGSTGAGARIGAGATAGTVSLEVLVVDLADLASIRAAAAKFLESERHLDVLVNNAGVMAIPYRQTADGFEMQFGTNHLGHFALTGLLLGSLMEAGSARIVTVSSNVHRLGRIDFDSISSRWQGQRGRYSKMGAYSQSKLANLLFAYELERRLRAAGAKAISVAAHPGWARTNLQSVGPRMEGAHFTGALTELFTRILAQDDAGGVLPVLYAATASGVIGGEYFGPNGPGHWRGYPVRVGSSAASHDPELARRLWELSEELTGVRYDFGG
jgi:NAD(P)-dependent dehydrogenase (short-subunit alcohol dehydrogenase family)